MRQYCSVMVRCSGVMVAVVKGVSVDAVSSPSQSVVSSDAIRVTVTGVAVKGDSVSGVLLVMVRARIRFWFFRVML